MISNKQLSNRAYSSKAIAFNEQLSISMKPGIQPHIDKNDEIPNGAVVQSDGSIKVSFYAPAAASVTIKERDGLFGLTRQENGLWVGVIPPSEPGYKPLDFEVDGTAVINPMAPIGYGSTRPMNCIDIPEEGIDYCMIKDVPHGSVSREFFFSKTTGNYESCIVYTPAGYMKGTEDYPVLYLQHGHGENETCWVWQGKVNFIMDNLIAEGKAAPAIIVMNNGMVQQKTEDGYVLNSQLLEPLLINDCIPFIENIYRVKTGKENRAMAGLSMGSMQTSVITMKHPDMFNYVGIFSGFIRDLIGRSPDGHSNDHLEAMDDAEKFKASYKLFFRAMGVDDQFVQTFKEDDAFLREKGLSPEQWSNHIRITPKGSHEWRCWRTCIYEFLKLIFK